MINTSDFSPGFVPSKDWMPSILEQYRISDFLDWHKEKRLELNPDFQRGEVWTPPARTFLIDTILRELPIPKVYLRSRVDVNTKKSVREVVDGQQRLRAVLDFANDKFVLQKRAVGFAGKKYSTLTPEQQETFLNYPIAVDQLMGASEDDVLEVFARLNSYTVPLNPPEKRHAKYQGDFKWAIRNSSRQWGHFWKKFNVLTTRERVRMMDDSLTAEMVGVLLNGVTDGGQPKINDLYRLNDAQFDTTSIINLDTSLRFIEDNFASSLVGTPLLAPPHLLMLFAATAFVVVGIPDGDLKPEELPTKLPMATDLDTVRDNLLTLGSTILSASEPPPPLAEFWRASKATTHRIASRRIRFPFFVKALTSKIG